jgi:hypothetical protein
MVSTTVLSDRLKRPGTPLKTVKIYGVILSEKFTVCTETDICTDLSVINYLTPCQQTLLLHKIAIDIASPNLQI